jgi:hypothetical protein
MQSSDSIVFLAATEHSAMMLYDKRPKWIFLRNYLNEYLILNQGTTYKAK